MAFGQVDDLNDLIDHQFKWGPSEDLSVLGFFIGNAEKDELSFAEVDLCCWLLVDKVWQQFILMIKCVLRLLVCCRC